MILQSLARLAISERLIPSPGYWREDISWIITISADGTPLGVQGPDSRKSITDKPNGNSKLEELSRWRWVPAVDKNNPGKLPDSPISNAQRLFGWLTLDKAGKDKTIAEARAKRDAMFQYLNTIAPQDPGMKAWISCLDRVASNPALLTGKWSPHPLRKAVTYRCTLSGNTFELDGIQSELIAFRLDGDDDLIVHRSAVRDALSESDHLKLAAQLQVHCLVSGDMAPAADKHPQVMLFPGTWISMVSCSPEHASFQHYQRKDLENAPVGTPAARAIGIALARLVAKKDEFIPQGQEYALPQRHLRLTKDILVLYWCESDSSGDPLDDPWITAIINPQVGDSEHIRQLFDRPWRSTGKLLAEQTYPFHALILGRNNKRAVVRSAMTRSVGQVVVSVKQWLDDIAVIPRFANDRTGLLDLIDATTRPKSTAGAVPDIAARIYSCAINHQQPFPAEILGIILGRIRSHDGASDKSDTKFDTTVSTARVALIKAILNRGLRLRPEHYRPIMHQEFTVSLDPDQPSPAYQLGRLFSLLERIQAEAIHDVNASISDRFLGSAMGAPSLVFPRLLKLSHHHLAKIENRGQAVNFDKLKDEIIGHLDSAIPRTQSLEEQGTFILGYHHQRAEFFRKKDVDSIPTTA
jgi:CRISPR-associated protein Csd1